MNTLGDSLFKILFFFLFVTFASSVTSFTYGRLVTVEPHNDQLLEANIQNDIVINFNENDESLTVIVNYSKELLSTESDKTQDEIDAGVFGAAIYLDNNKFTIIELKKKSSEFTFQIPYNWLFNGNHLIKVEILNGESIVTSKEAKFQFDASPTITIRPGDDTNDQFDLIIDVNYKISSSDIYGYLDIYLDSTLLLSKEVKSISGQATVRLSDLPIGLYGPGRIPQGNHLLTIKAQAVNNSVSILNKSLTVEFKPSITPLYNDKGVLESLSSNLPIEYPHHKVVMQVFCGQTLLWSSDINKGSSVVSGKEIEQSLKSIPAGDDCKLNGVLVSTQSTNGVENWKNILLIQP